MNNSRITRKFERLLFKGIPEQPEAVYERDDNSHVLMRLSGKSPSGLYNYEFSENAQVIGYFEYDSKEGTENYTSLIEKVSADPAR